jgi:biofilm PGA synthesis lipoprotein PgaB
MRLALCLLLLMASTVAVNAQPRGQRFVAVSFHDIIDQGEEAQEDAVSGNVLAQFFDWMKATGWTAVTLDDLAAAQSGARPLPAKAIVLTFDDGYRSLYTRVFPLLKAYRYPAVAAVVGKWMEGGPGTKVQYGDELVPRSKFISWAEAREMQASGLVEFASHSYDMH